MIYSVQDLPMPVVKGPNDVIVKIEATPINPSDLGSIGMMAKFGAKGPTLDLPDGFKAVPDGFSMQSGNEGCGIVVAAGTSAEAQALMGKRVACATGKMYAQYAKALTTSPMFAAIPDELTALESSSVFVNPLTVVGFIDTMRTEGHTAIVHTAAASQLGRMLAKYCQQLGIGLVNIVRKESSAQVLRDLGEKHVIVSTSATYEADLVTAITETKATLGFDAVRGGSLAAEIIIAMEKALVANGEHADPAYGTFKLKQVYVYGGLSQENCLLKSGMGMTWQVGGWIMPGHYRKPTAGKLSDAVSIAVKGLKTTFSTTFGKHLSLDDMVDGYMSTLVSQTDAKFLVCPNGDIV